MRCPECGFLIEQTHVKWNMHEENDYIEVDIECSECEKEFFTRIKPEDLIDCES